MRQRVLIKYFEWREQDRDDVTLGDDTRINPQTDRAQLKADASGYYPLTADLYVKSRLTDPKAVRKWTGFEAYVVHKTSFENVQVTGAKFRIGDGTAEYYWTGSVWATAGASNWNTEAEIATNISSFDAVAQRKLQVIVNLSTTDKTQTPELVHVKVLYEAMVEFLEDIVLRSLVPMIRDNVRPISRAVFEMPATGTTFNISDAELETGYEVVDVDSVFDHTTDAEHLVDLLSSYNSSTGLVTLGSSVAKDQLVWVRFVYEPVVAISTSQDFVEAERVPAIVLTDIGYVAPAAPAASGDDSVADKSAGTAVVVPSPLQGDLGFTLLGLTDKVVDNQRLLEEINSFFANHHFVKSTGLDERYRLHLIDEYAATGEPRQAEIYMGRATFQIRHFRQWLADAYDDYIVGNLKLTFSSQ